MAITIKQSPQFMMPVYNPIVFTVDSTNKTQCAFRYLCDIYVGGLLIKRLTLFPTGTNGYAEFQVERVLQDLLSFDLKENLYGSTLFEFSTNSYLTYLLKFGEEYDSSAQCDVGTTVFADLTLSSSIGTFQVFNGALQPDEWLDWSYTKYEALTPSATQESKFLTKTPDEVFIKYGDQMVWNIFTGPGLVSKLQVKTYDSAGTILNTFTYSNGLASTNLDVLSVGVGPENLNNTTLLTGVQPVINSTVKSYTVQLLGPFDIDASELRTIKIDTRDVKYTPHRLWWLGSLGGFDSYTFTLKDKFDTQISRTEFNRIFGAYRDLSPGTTWDYKKRDRGRTTLSVNAQDGMVYESNWLTETEALWMKELYASLEVYEISTNGILCFDSITGVVSPNNVTINLGGGVLTGEEIVVGAILNVDVGVNPTYDPLNGEFEILAVGDNDIQIANPSNPDTGEDTVAPGNALVSGQLLLADYVAILTPLIIKSDLWEEKTKNKIKNINYIIELDKSHAVNKQRN